MKIYTSYFAMLKKIPDGVVPISICGKAPAWYFGAEYKTFAPKYGFFMEWKQNKDNDYYIKCFNEQVLSCLNVEQVIKELTAISGGKDICLVCYEKPGDFCHRHLVANWFNQFGFNVEEIKF